MPVRINWTKVSLLTVGASPYNYFLENLAVRADNSVLVTALNHKELWYVPSSPDGAEVAPRLLFTLPHLAMGIVEGDPDIFYIATSEIYSWSASHLYRLDLNGWTPGKPVTPEVILHFPEPVRGLNGSCVIAPGVILIADCFGSLIWRVDLNTHDGKAKASVWLKHDSMGYYPGQMKPEQPGVNGVQYSPKRGYLYFTNTAKQLFLRVKVEPETYNPVGEPEVVGGGRMFDDFWILCANSSQAKGRVERANRTLQDRLVKELRLAGICDVIAGNAFLPEFVERFNEKFALPPAKANDLHGKLNVQASRLADILCHREQRYVGQQLSLAYDRKQIILERSELADKLAGQYVDLYDFTDRPLEVRWKGHSLPYRVFSKDQRVSHTAIVENKRLGHALALVKAQQDVKYQTKVKTNSEKTGYKKDPRRVYGPDFEPKTAKADAVEMPI